MEHSMPVLFTVDEPRIVKELGHDPEICRNAAFVFDSPLTIKPGEYLALENGQVFLIVRNIHVPVPGKWDR